MGATAQHDGRERGESGRGRVSAGALGEEAEGGRVLEWKEGRVKEGNKIRALSDGMGRGR